MSTWQETRAIVEARMREFTCSWCDATRGDPCQTFLAVNACEKELRDALESAS